MSLLTKSKAELLKLFLTNPDRTFYMQEIGRILGRKPGSFQRALNNMVSEGILTSEYRAKARFFKANKKYPIYKELKSIVFKTVGVQGSIRDVLEEIGNIKFAFIYGAPHGGQIVDTSSLQSSFPVVQRLSFQRVL